MTMYEAKKLCFIIPEYYSSAATHFNYLYKLISLLEKETDIFLIVERGDNPDFLKKGYFYVQKFRILPLRFIEDFLILLYVRLLGYQDFYVHYSFLSAFNASLIIKFLGGRTFYWNCGLPWLYKRGLIRKTFELLTYKFITYLVTGTENLKKEYALHCRMPLSRIKAMPNWINLSDFRPDSGRMPGLKKELNLSARNKVLLFVHRLSKRKGAHYLPEILKSLSEENVVLLIIGDGPERPEIESRINNYGLSARARFLGQVPNKDIRNYFGIADIFIMPSEEEGFPHVLLESMAAAVPFVAFNVGGVGEITPPEFSEYLAAGGNLEIFVEKVKKLLYIDSKYLEILKQSELKWVRQFDIKFAVVKFNKLLN